MANDRVSVLSRQLSYKIDEFIDSTPFFDAWIRRHDKSSVSRFLASFEHLVSSFPSLIALAAACVDGNSRLTLAQNLLEECGNGNLTRSHHAIFLKYLRSAGVNLTSYDTDLHTDKWRSRLWNYILAAETPEKVIGAVAAGECLARPALQRIYEILRTHHPDADAEYFTQHLELEQIHVGELCKLIVDHCETDAQHNLVTDGFDAALQAWGMWFDGVCGDLFGI
jgi:pyrroloquinoline quinone (PQQ) biosynthesis protein C